MLNMNNVGLLIDQCYFCKTAYRSVHLNLSFNGSGGTPILVSTCMSASWATFGEKYFATFCWPPRLNHLQSSQLISKEMILLAKTSAVSAIKPLYPSFICIPFTAMEVPTTGTPYFIAWLILCIFVHSVINNWRLL